MLTIMQTTAEIKTLEDSSNSFDILSQGFDGGSFYGLEYILEDFFQSATVKPSVFVRSTIDWFGLDS
jgi:hypothetical protein